MFADNAAYRSSKRRITLTILASAALFTGYQAASYLSQRGVLSFLKGILRNPTTVGAVAPCSEAVAQETIRHLSFCKQDFVRVLEVGGGTGQFTHTVEDALEKLVLDGSVKDYKVDVVEIDNEYCDELKRMFAHNDQIEIHCKDASLGFGEHKYDYIISSLPFTNLDPELVNTILDQYKASIKPTGVVSYIEHRFIQPIISLFLFGKKSAEFKRRKEYLTQFKAAGNLEIQPVWRNILPMLVYHIQF